MRSAEQQGDDRAVIRTAVGTVLADEPTVAAAYLYGSVVRGSATALSDLDLALVLAADEDDSEHLRVRLRVMDRLRRLLPQRESDVTVLEDLPIAVAGRVVGEGVLVYERDAARRVAVEAATRMAYHDFLPFENRGTREGLRALRERYGVG